MANAVITGGTNGIGRALAERLADEGHRVAVVGRSAAAPDGVELIRGDLGTVAGTTAVADEVTARFDVVDHLVLGAGRFTPRRVVTADGLEHSFALYAVSRFALVERLLPVLERSAAPVVVSLCGVAGLRGPGIQWDDLALSRRFRAFGAVSQGARAADLLGAGFADRHPGSAVRYVLHNPMFVDSGLGAQVGGPLGRALDLLARLFARSTADAAGQVHRFLADPPTAALTASRAGAPVDLARPEFDRATAARLYAVLEDITASAR
ncbi:SDR family NAD(P)-dependent oxidoreductase [Saccharothrix luteola]|uniref:SDR family NAD(P)-dependent oxidoreductase n=1 Tax=Saccharothrix luteola TaxID=2893018 RepID=UPI001E2B2271|nr:SDR family NAD(P)-dependent oxidoreductase [Saccharothrix luteola]MCC8251096.1 SDR family NAD(P)-dependent oxidoreductase [Saccharothrix luteola]